MTDAVKRLTYYISSSPRALWWILMFNWRHGFELIHRPFQDAAPVELVSTEEQAPNVSLRSGSRRTLRWRAAKVNCLIWHIASQQPCPRKGAFECASFDIVENMLWLISKRLTKYIRHPYAQTSPARDRRMLGSFNSGALHDGVPAPDSVVDMPATVFSPTNASPKSANLAWNSSSIKTLT
jgi:hypothetical protein